MTGSSHDPMDAVSALMDERSRYESWLATLETRRASTPNHVYDRVRGDYQARLKGVLDQLSGRASELQERADRLRSRASELQRQEDAHRDERAEAELRAAVGEHTPEQWQDIRERADSEIARLSAERAELEADAEKVRQVLAVANVARPEPAARPRAEPEPARRGPPEPLVRPADVAPRTPPRGGSFDELAFLKSVVPPRGGTTAPAEPQAAAEAPTSTPPGSTAGVGSDRGGRGERSAESPAFGTPSGRGRGDSGRSNNEGVPAFLKDVPSEQVKTLRCQECGTMNYPTEWYCERCGGELAAM
jgi:hypothetical protein